MFTAEDKTEIVKMVTEAMNAHRESRRLQWEQEKKEKGPVVTRLYLVTIQHHDGIGFPIGDGSGRVVMHHTFYARVPLRDADDYPMNFGGRVEVVAFGDGRLLKQPFGVFLAGSAYMAEVREGFLEGVKE